MSWGSKKRLELGGLSTFGAHRMGLNLEFGRKPDGVTTVSGQLIPHGPWVKRALCAARRLVVEILA